MDKKTAKTKVGEEHDYLSDILEKPSKKGPETNCVKEIDEVVWGEEKNVEEIKILTQFRIDLKHAFSNPLA